MSVHLDFFLLSRHSTHFEKKNPNKSQNMDLFLTDFVLVGLSVYISL